MLSRTVMFRRTSSANAGSCVIGSMVLRVRAVPQSVTLSALLTSNWARTVGSSTTAAAAARMS